MKVNKELVRRLRLSVPQVELLRAMNAGWELARNTAAGASVGRSYWIQEGGAGRSGATKTVNTGTAAGLLDLDLAKLAKKGFPTTTFRLTERGRAVLGLNDWPESDDDRLLRLPKWARDEIVRLRGNAEHARAQEVVNVGNVKDARILYHPHAGRTDDCAPIGLDDKEPIRFIFGPRTDDFIDVIHRGNHLEVRAGAMIGLWCDSSNVVRIEPAGWDRAPHVRKD